MPSHQVSLSCCGEGVNEKPDAGHLIDCIQVGPHHDLSFLPIEYKDVCSQLQRASALMHRTSHAPRNPGDPTVGPFLEPCGDPRGRGGEFL